MKTIINAIGCVRRKRSAILFFFLAVAITIFVIYSMAVKEFQHEVNSTIIFPRVSIDPDMHNGLCTFQPLSPEDALEERLLLESIVWPKTPPLSDRHSLNQTSDPAHSTFTILPRRGGGQWHVGDQLEVMITVSDFQGRPKKFGGDFLLARLHNLKLGAGVAGQVVDHLNGSYSAVFSLLWEGVAQVEVTLVHPSEAIPVLERLNREEPDRIYFKSLFRSGSLSETTICNVCLRPTVQPLCNYTDLRTGEPWLCYKPKMLSCEARIDHSIGGVKRLITPNEKKLFQSGVNLKVHIQASGPANVTVWPKEEGSKLMKWHQETDDSHLFLPLQRVMRSFTRKRREDQPALKSRTVTSGPSGYYYQGAWQALNGTTVHQFHSSAITQCLKGKVVHMHGDSTVRQFFEFLNAVLPDLKEFDLHNLKKVGPFISLDYLNNILVTFRCHGPPIRIASISTSELRYIANELNDLKGGTNTVVVFGIWAHFGSFPMEVYIRRLQNIRRAMVRLLDRAPGTMVIIRTGNPQSLSFTPYSSLTNSDWYSLQLNKVLRAMFKGLNVHLINAWEMVLAHHLPHNLHPQPIIIKNIMNVIMSHICPLKNN